MERLFGRVFKGALEDPAPLGLKRLKFEELPDQYVELSRTALLLPGDAGDAAMLRPLLANTQLEGAPLRCACVHACSGDEGVLTPKAKATAAAPAHSQCIACEHGCIHTSF